MRVREVENGRAGLACVAERRPDVILLDLIMPEMDGFQFLAELQKRAAWCTIPVVAITAMELSDEDRVRLSENAARIVDKRLHEGEALLQGLCALVDNSVQRSGASDGDGYRGQNPSG